MVPNFALSLSFEGIALLRRMDDGWARIADAALDSADLDAEMHRLRAEAQALDPDGADVALVIPNEQIRYIDLPDLGGDAAMRETAILAALDGATPYAVSDLGHDHSLAGGRLKIAAVARETLQEAEAFATQHGFAPVSFLANPPDGAFDGAVFFGAAASWKGAAPSRPAEALRIVPADAAARQPLAAPEPAADVAAEPDAGDPVIAADAEQDARDVPAAEAKIPPAPPEVAGTAAEEPGPATRARLTALALAAIDPDEEPDEIADKAPDQSGDADATVDTAPTPSFSTIRARRDGDAGIPKAPSVLLTAPTAVPGKPRFTPVPGDSGALKSAGITSDRLDADGTDTESAGLGAAAAQAARSFFSRRKPAEAEGVADSAETSPAGEKPGAPPLGRATKPRGKPPAVPPLKRDPAPAKAAPRLAAIAARTADTSNDADTGREAFNPLAGLTALRGTARPEPALAGAGGAAVLSPQDERERMTIFGARERERSGARPRMLGLALTAVLLLFLAGVAAWASVFLDDGLARFFRSEPENRAIAALPEVVAAPAEPDLAVRAAVAPTPQAVALAPVPPLVQRSTEGAGSGEDVVLAALDTTPDASDARPVLSAPIAPRALSPEEAIATYAATGYWLRAPDAPHLPPVQGVEDVYVASIDPAVEPLDAVALPALNSVAPDAAMEEPGLPPPAGLRFDFDARDLVRATPEGALNPDGLRIYTGRPPAVPPLRGAAPDLDTPAVPDAALAALRPAARPDDLVEQKERADLGGFSREELSGLRPVLRPRTAQDDAREEEPDEPATAQAVRRSLVPVNRPRDMASIVRRTERLQERQEAREEEDAGGEDAPTRTAAVAQRTVRPSGPTGTSVAKQATVRNAINLNRISLIGVYGTPQNRRALVRMANGDYKKVKVGDRIDGGRVRAIGDSDLSYAKGGRSVTLTMPRS